MLRFLIMVLLDMEIDGFIEFQIKNRFFIESSINYEIGNSFNFRNDHTLSFSSSIGAIRNIRKGLHAVGGLSNYTELNNDNLNELFVGMISKYLTGILYGGIEGSLAPNFLGIVDINSFLKNIIPDLGPLSVLWVVVVTISQ